MCSGVFGVCINSWRPYDARVDIVSLDHGLWYDHCQAIILTKPDISLIVPLETKAKEKQNNFRTMWN